MDAAGADFQSVPVNLTETEMSWNYECATWTDGMVLECFSPDTTIELSGQFRGRMKPPHNFTPLQRFNYYISKGPSRKLTFEEHRLKCMQGLLNTCQPPSSTQRSSFTEYYGSGRCGYPAQGFRAGRGPVGWSKYQQR